MTNTDRIYEAIRANPGRTERELSKIAFGQSGYPQQVNGPCRALLMRDLIRRFGSGDKGFPYRYYAADVADELMRGKEPKYGERSHEAFLIERRSMLEIKLGIIEDKIAKARKTVRERDIDEFSQIQLPTDAEIGVTLSLLRITNTQLELLRKSKDRRDSPE